MLCNRPALIAAARGEPAPVDYGGVGTKPAFVSTVVAPKDVGLNPLKKEFGFKP